MFKDYKSQATWDKEGNLKNLTLSTGKKVVPETTISSIFGLMDFLWKNYRSELTFWGKFSYWMNQ